MTTEDGYPYAEWDINPDVSVAWNREDEAAFRASQRTGNLFQFRAPGLAEIAKKLGVPLYVPRTTP